MNEPVITLAQHNINLTKTAKGLMRDLKKAIHLLEYVVIEGQASDELIDEISTFTADIQARIAERRTQ